VCKKWNQNFVRKCSKEFHWLIKLLEGEMVTIFPQEIVKVFEARKIDMKSEEFFVTFVCELISSDMMIEKFMIKLKNHVYVTGKLNKVRVKLEGLQSVQIDEEELENFLRTGYEKCAKCGEKN
jgi:hypothetical protein